MFRFLHLALHTGWGKKQGVKILLPHPVIQARVIIFEYASNCSLFYGWEWEKTYVAINHSKMRGKIMES